MNACLREKDALGIVPPRNRGDVRHIDEAAAEPPRRNHGKAFAYRNVDSFRRNGIHASVTERAREPIFGLLLQFRDHT
jgi:hypothetical protein